MTWVLAALAVLASAGAGEPETMRNSVGMALVQVPAGSFAMGSDAGDWDEQPTHRVVIRNPFWISTSPVTLDQYKAFAPEHAAAGPNGEVVGVSWDDADNFCRWLSEKEGKPYRLPTEAEWEYACRAGTKSAFASGDQPPQDSAWANAWGLRGMHDETPEWCRDWYGPYVSGEEADPAGPDAGLTRVVRGNRLDAGNDQIFVDGKADPFHRRSANRASMAQNFGHAQGGIAFRVVQAPAPESTRPAEVPFVRLGVKAGTKAAVERGPDPDKPYFRKRYLLPTPPETSSNPAHAETIRRAGLHPSLSGHNHCPALAVCPNGDLLMVIYTSWHEYEPGVSLIATRLRFGADRWDMPEVLVDFADANDHAPLLWIEQDRVYLFWGSPWLAKGGSPFQWTTSDDSGATWQPVRFPRFEGPIGPHARQPINSALRAADGTLYVSSDGEGGTSVLWGTRDNGETWFDTGGRSAGRHTTYAFLKDGRILGMGGKNTDIEGYMPKAISADGGKTWTVEKTNFAALGANQRPSVLRLKSGRLFFASDFQKREGVKPAGIADSGSFVALSDDDGATWRMKKLDAAQPHEHSDFFAGADTIGYSVARQSPDGLIHLVATMNRPCLHFTMNEAWILSDAPADSNDEVTMANSATSVGDVQAFAERYPDDKVRVSWSAGTGNDGRYLLHGKETWFYPDGARRYEVEYDLGRKVGLETYWEPDGRKRWEWDHAEDGSGTWRQWWDNGILKSRSGWRNMHAEGMARLWDRDGNLISDAGFENGTVSTSHVIPPKP